MAENPVETLKTLIVDDEPLAVERMQVICAKIPAIQVVGTASDGDWVDWLLQYFWAPRPVSPALPRPGPGPTAARWDGSRLAP